MSEHEHGTFSILKAFVLGAITGAGLALLFAPYSGKETRKKLVEKKDDAKKVLKDTTDQVIKKGGELIEDGKKTVESLKGEMAKVVDEGKKSLHSIRNEITKCEEESKDSVKKTVKEEMAALENELTGRKKKAKP